MLSLSFLGRRRDRVSVHLCIAWLCLSLTEVVPVLARRCSEALLDAARYGDEDQLLQSLEVERVDCVDENLRTPLHIAAAENQIQVAYHLLAQGALMEKDNLGRTPLHSSVIAGLANMTKLLLQTGAYIELRDYAQRTPLHHAAFYGHEDIIPMLLQSGANIDAVDCDSRAALHYTVRLDDYLNSSKLLVQRGATLDLQDLVGFTPLHVACFENQIKTVQFLCDSGGDLYMVDKAGWNPIIHAAAREHKDLVNYLIIRTLQPRTYPEPDPSKFMVQDINRSAILGLPGWVFGLTLICCVGCGAIWPTIVFMRRFNSVRKPYFCDTTDEAIEAFINEVWHSVMEAKGQQNRLYEEWDRVPAHTLKDLHKVKK